MRIPSRAGKRAAVLDTFVGPRDALDPITCLDLRVLDVPGAGVQLPGVMARVNGGPWHGGRVDSVTLSPAFDTVRLGEHLDYTDVTYVLRLTRDAESFHLECDTFVHYTRFGLTVHYFHNCRPTLHRLEDRGGVAWLR